MSFRKLKTMIRVLTDKALHFLILFIFAHLFLVKPAIAGMPADAVPIDVTGQLTVLHVDDFKLGKSKYVAYIEDAKKNSKFNLLFDGDIPSELQTGATVRIKGHAKGNDLYLAADGSITSNIEILSPAAATVEGVQQTIVMVVDFKDAAVSCSVDSIRNQMFSDPQDQTVDHLFQETSLGHVSFNGDVVGKYAINYASTDSCDVNAWAKAADNAAIADGVNLGNYNRKVYVLPSKNSCGWSGLGSVGGNPSSAWIMRCDLGGVYAHELGHNLGMNHASTSTAEYGDTSDVMGSELSGLRQINAPHQEQMGWRSPDKTINVNESGLYDIAPLELDATQTQAPQTLKIAKPDTGEYYYVSYRQPIGFDANLPSSLTERVHIHRYAAKGGRTYLLSGLLTGSSFTDSKNGFSITHISHNPDFASVQIQLDSQAATCTTAKPTTSISPSSQSASGGSTLNYTVSVTNTDSTACSGSTFNVVPTLPSGWTSTSNPASITLAPGQTANSTLSVTSPQNTLASSYTLKTDIVDAANSTHAASSSATYTVMPSCTTTTPSVTLSPGTQSGFAGNTLNYGVTVTNLDDTSCASRTFSMNQAVPSGWTGALSVSNIVLSPGQTGQSSLSVTSPSATSAGSYNINVAAVDSNDATKTASRTAVYSVVSNADTQAPTAPGKLTASVKRGQVNLAWLAATDNVGVSGYRIYRDGNLLFTTSSTSHIDKAVNSGSTYNYYVVAYDAAANVSPAGNTATATIGSTRK